MPEYEQRTDRFTADEEYGGYTVRDLNGEKIGKVDDLFLDENDQPEYFGVKMGFLGMSATLIPAHVAAIDHEQGFIEISQPKNTVKDGPAFDDDQQITPEYEQQVREYYGLENGHSSEQRGAYGDYYSDGEHHDSERHDSGKVGPGMREGDTETGEFRGHAADDEGVNQTHGSDLEDEDELRVQRTEEELRAGTHEREAGKMNVRKRVRTDREQVAVPTKHEEVNVERVPVNEERAGAEIGEDEVSVPLVEEEVVVGKQAVVKEEIRVRKDVVNEEEVVEEDVRKEEVDVDDQTTGRGGRPGGTAGRDNDDLEDETRRHNR
jgi:uncharacterized protein (TIGR02271 family)